MRTWPAIVLLGVVASATRGADADDLGAALEALSSPFAERREEAAAVISRAPPEESSRLAAAYSRGDYALRSALIDALAQNPGAAFVPLVVSDLGTADRGVRNAQRRFASALYGRARRLASGFVLAMAGAGDFAAEEALRALPGPGAGPRRALQAVVSSADPARRAAGRKVAEAVAEVDVLREGVEAARRSGDAATAEGAREMLRHLFRHDVERALLAVLETCDLAGSYDGMYGIVGELAVEGGPRPGDVLLSIVVDRAPTEAGVPGPPGGYRFLEEAPPGLLPDDLRDRAAACLGEVGGPEEAAGLLEFYGSLPDQKPNRYEDPRIAVAMPLAALGETAPLRALVEDYEQEVAWQADLDARGVASELAFFNTGWVHEELAMFLTRLGDLAGARRHWELALRDPERPIVRWYNYACLLSRVGALREALTALRTAVEGGYALDPSNVAWMDRDRDLAALRATDGYRRLREEIREGRHGRPRPGR